VPGEPDQGMHSTDQGDLSWRVPTGSLVVASYALGAPGHCGRSQPRPARPSARRRWTWRPGRSLQRASTC
jgi:hypothetical protein